MSFAAQEAPRWLVGHRILERAWSEKVRKTMQGKDVVMKRAVSRMCARTTASFGCDFWPRFALLRWRIKNPT